VRRRELSFLHWNGSRLFSAHARSYNLASMSASLIATFCRQVQPRNTGKQYTGVWRSLVRMWKEEGFKGFMRGNGINCVRIIPYSAVQFTTYEQLKRVRSQ
jgi:Mitochondrial carrier protein